MAAICSLYAIHAQGSDGVDGQLAKRVIRCVHRFDFKSCVEIGLKWTIRNNLASSEDNDFRGVSQSWVLAAPRA